MKHLPLSEWKTLLDNGDISAVELAQFYLKEIELRNNAINGFVHVDRETTLKQAEASDQRRKKGQPGVLEGLPMAIKDIFCTKDMPTTCCSNILKGFQSTYDAHVIERLNHAGIVSLGKTNMDEFAMGSSNETSCFGTVHNPWDTARTAGGSSGGSAAVIAAGLAPAATGTDTGGSIRQPASFTNTVGLKPTYGRISRRGIIAFASSLDQAGPITQTVADTALMAGVMCGHDALDATSVKDAPEIDWLGAASNKSLKGRRIGLPKEYFIDGIDTGVKQSIDTALKTCESMGAELVDISLPHTAYAVAAYYVIAPSEASANLSRYDGVRYGQRCDNPADLNDLYTRTRDEGFGAEVKRRILTGTFALSSGYYDAYYKQAQKIRTLIRQDFRDAFDKVDIIATPTTPGTAFKLGEKSDDPLTMYLNDIFTISVNLAGLPGLSQPCGFADGLPVGLQWIAPAWKEDTLISTAAAYEVATDWHTKQAGQ